MVFFEVDRCLNISPLFKNIFTLSFEHYIELICMFADCKKILYRCHTFLFILCRMLSIWNLPCSARSALFKWVQLYMTISMNNFTCVTGEAIIFALKTLLNDLKLRLGIEFCCYFDILSEAQILRNGYFHGCLRWSQFAFFPKWMLYFDEWLLSKVYIIISRLE